jgi:L-fuculose-phosphate aldolase
MNSNILKEAICDVGRKLYARGFVAANDGNISARLDDNRYLITPTGVSKGDLTPDMILTLAFDGTVLEGVMCPSSEYRLHTAVYEARSDVGAVVHAHPAFATTMAAMGEALERFVVSEAAMSVGKVPVVSYAKPGSDELAVAAGKAIAHCSVLLLEYHGALAVGLTLQQALFNMESTEFFAKVTYLMKLAGSQRALPDQAVAELLMHK